MLVFIGWALPAPERAARGVTRLDTLLPRYQFYERHTRSIDAPSEVVWRALHQVTASDIRFFRLLTTVRRAGRSGPEDILNAPAHRPIIDVALGSGFTTLANVPSRELVIGTFVAKPREVDQPRTAAAFRNASSPGYAKAAMNFHLEPDRRGGTVVHTETRVFATDARTARRFAAYWRVIYPGSALIRREWLSAIEQRAEKE